jgi:hypothetical protein
MYLGSPVFRVWLAHRAILTRYHTPVANFYPALSIKCRLVYVCSYDVGLLGHLSFCLWDVGLGVEIRVFRPVVGYISCSLIF